MHDEKNAQAWEERLLLEMRTEPKVFCYPGLMGSVCERLVQKGFASREEVGRQQQPAEWPDTAKGRKEWAARAGMQYRYTITLAGRMKLGL